MYETDMKSQVTDVEQDDHTFYPSMKILSRIMTAMMEFGPMGKTLLSQQAKISYDRLVMYVEWLEKKQFMESLIESHKIKLRLTEDGRQFATHVCSLDL